MTDNGGKVKDTGEVLGPSNLRIRWRDLSWYIVAFTLFSLAILIRLLLPIFTGEVKPIEKLMSESRPRGFDVSNLIGDRELLVLSGLPKDGLSALVNPETVSGIEVAALNKKQRRREHTKFIIPSDRVIGVEIGGVARAYPIRFLNWHEIANDTLGGVPIAVTYSPICDSVAVFDRRIGGETLEFGVSGLLYNSNLVMYDRRESEPEESLWSQLEMQAISGPMAGTQLTALPSKLVRWGDWLAEHPDTEMIAGDPKSKENYSANPYQTYFASGKLRFPVSPMPPSGGANWKTRIAIIGAGGETACYFVQNPGGDDFQPYETKVTIGGLLLDVKYVPPSSAYAPEVLAIGGAGFAGLDFAIYSFYGAWHAAHSDMQPALLP